MRVTCDSIVIMIIFCRVKHQHVFALLSVTMAVIQALCVLFSSFLLRDAMYMLSLSVCPSVTSQSATKMAKPRITRTTPYDSPWTLVYRCQKSRRNKNGITLNGGTK